MRNSLLLLLDQIDIPGTPFIPYPYPILKCSCFLTFKPNPPKV